MTVAPAAAPPDERMVTAGLTRRFLQRPELGAAVGALAGHTVRHRELARRRGTPGHHGGRRGSAHDRW